MLAANKKTRIISFSFLCLTLVLLGFFSACNETPTSEDVITIDLQKMYEAEIALGLKKMIENSMEGKKVDKIEDLSMSIAIADSSIPIAEILRENFCLLCKHDFCGEQKIDIALVAPEICLIYYDIIILDEGCDNQQNCSLLLRQLQPFIDSILNKIKFKKDLKNTILKFTNKRPEMDVFNIQLINGKGEKLGTFEKKGVSRYQFGGRNKNQSIGNGTKLKIEFGSPGGTKMTSFRGVQF